MTKSWTFLRDGSEAPENSYPGTLGEDGYPVVPEDANLVKDIAEYGRISIADAMAIVVPAVRSEWDYLKERDVPYHYYIIEK